MLNYFKIRDENEPELYTVEVGLHDQYSNNEQWIQSIGVSKMRTHSNYNNVKLTNDISLLKLTVCI